MTVELYKGKRDFEHEGERRAFRDFFSELWKFYNDDSELVAVVLETSANGAEPDLVVISSRTILLVNLKSLEATKDFESGEIAITAHESECWSYTLPDGKKVTVGGLSAHNQSKKNPFRQAKDHYYDFTDWLLPRSSDLFGEAWTKEQAQKNTYSWVAVYSYSNPLSIKSDIPKLPLYRWFKVMPNDRLRKKMADTPNEGLHLSDCQIRSLAAKLGDKDDRCAQYLSEYERPVPRVFFFSNPACKPMVIAREDERGGLEQFLENSTPSILALWGPEGIGKTTLATWLADNARVKGCALRWVNCAERTVSDEGLLSGMMEEISDKNVTAFAMNKIKALENRLEAAISSQYKSKTLFVFDDFHKAPEKAIAAFLKLVVRDFSHIKVLLVSTNRPACIYNSEWQPGTTEAIQVGRFPKTAIQPYFQLGKGHPLTPEQEDLIWVRTGGIPRAMNIFHALLDQHGWGENVTSLPLYNAGQTERAWVESFMSVLDAKLQQKISPLSIVRGAMDCVLMRQLLHESPAAVSQIAERLLEAGIIHCGENADQYILLDFVRDYLGSLMDKSKTAKAHLDGGNYYAAQAAETGDNRTKAKLLSDALDHFEKCEEWQKLADLSSSAYEIYQEIGDQGSARTIAGAGLHAAREQKNLEQTVYWLVEIADREIEEDDWDAAQKHLKDAQDNLNKIKAPQSGPRPDHLVRLQARLWSQLGRLHYRKQDYLEADKIFAQVLDLANQLDDRQMVADSLVRIGQIERHRKQYERAWEHFQKGLELSQEINDSGLKMQCYTHLGLLARDHHHDFRNAAFFFDRALKLAKKNRDQVGIETNSSMLGDLEMRLGKYHAAEALFRESLDISQKSHNAIGIRISQGYLAEVMIHFRNFSGAQAYLDDNEKRCQKIMDQICIAWTLRRRGLLLKARDHQLKTGDALIRRGAQLLAETGNTNYLDDFEKVLGPLSPDFFAND